MDQVVALGADLKIEEQDFNMAVFGRTRAGAPIEPTHPGMRRWQANMLLMMVAVIWGSAFVAQSVVMAHLGPMTFTGVRFLIGAAVVAPLAWHEWQHRPAGRSYTSMDALQVGGLGLLLMLGATMQQVGIQSTTVTNAGILTALYVPLVPLLGWMRHGRRPRAGLWPAAGGCVLGSYLLSGAGSLSVNPGDLWVLTSSLPWAMHVLLVGEVAARLRAPFLVACGQFLVCGLSALAWAAFIEPASWAALAAGAASLLYTGVLSVGVGFTAQVVAQRHTEAADAAIVMSSEVVFAALFGHLLMGDRLTPTGWLGAALIVGCMLAVQLLALREPAHRPRQAPAAPLRS